MSNEKQTTEEALIVKDLKEIAKGEQGQFIKLLDIQLAEEQLRQLADKYKELEVTEENYKKEAAEAEKELRQSRYALQRIYNANKDFLNTVKKEEKELYDRLIAVIQPEEERIKEKIDQLKEEERKKKEEEERKEKERIEAITKALEEVEKSLERAILTAKKRQDLIEFDGFLEGLKFDFETFDELEFKAKRLHAVYSARRSEIIKAIEEEEEKQAERERMQEQLKEQKKLEEKRNQGRIQILQKMGVSHNQGKFNGFGRVVSENIVFKMDELEFFEMQEDFRRNQQHQQQQAEKKAKQQEEAKKQEEQKKLEQARKDWDDMFLIYQKLGGDATKFRLKPGQVPSQNDVKKLSELTKELQEKARKAKTEEQKKKIEAIKKELKNYKDETLRFCEALENTIELGDFEHEESESIVRNFSKRLGELVNEVFGEVYNK